jgi:hypothetical protein
MNEELTAEERRGLRKDTQRKAFALSAKSSAPSAVRNLAGGSQPRSGVMFIELVMKKRLSSGGA